MIEHEGKVALRRILEQPWRIWKDELGEAAAYVAELEAEVAAWKSKWEGTVDDMGKNSCDLMDRLARSEKSAKTWLQATHEREKERDEARVKVAELEAQVALSDSLLRLLWSWAPALQHRTGCEMAGHPGPGCICTCGRDAVLTQIDEHLARTAPKDPQP